MRQVNDGVYQILNLTRGNQKFKNEIYLQKVANGNIFMMQKIK